MRRSVRGVWWCTLALFAGLGVGLAWHRSHSQIIPECAAGVDLEVRGQVLAADRKPTGEWSLDVRVMGYDEGQTLKRPSMPQCQNLVGKRLLVRWRAQERIQAGEQWLFTLKLRVPWGQRIRAALITGVGCWPVATPQRATSRKVRSC
jgi:hypothetical protein